MAQQLAAVFARDRTQSPSDVVARHSGSARVVISLTHNAAAANALTPNNNKTSCVTDAVATIKSNGLAGSNANIGNFVFQKLMPGCSDGFKCRGIENALDLDHAGFDGLRSQLKHERHIDRKGIVADPEEASMDLASLGRADTRMTPDLSSLNENLFLESNRNGFADQSARLGSTRSPIFDSLDATALAVGPEGQLVSHAKTTSLDASSKDTALVEAIHILQNQTQWQSLWRHWCGKLIKRL